MGIFVTDFFDRCKACKACCKTSDRFVHIYICGHEKRLRERLSSLGHEAGEIVVERGASCRFMTDDGCTLGKGKPFQCRLYPLLLLEDGSIGIDPACTHSGEYIAQMDVLSSDARRHFEAVKNEAARLSDKERSALAGWSRYVCDVVRLDPPAKH